MVQRAQQHRRRLGQEPAALLGPPAAGDVLDDQHEVPGLAPVAQQRGVQLDPQLAARTVGQARLPLGARADGSGGVTVAAGLPVGQRLQRLQIFGHRLGIGHVLVVQPAQLGLGVPQHVAQVAVGPQPAPVQRQVGDAHRCLVEGGGVLALALAQGLFPALAFGLAQLPFLAADAQRPPVQLQEHVHLGPHDLRLQRLDQIVHRPHRIRLVDEVDVAAGGGEEDDGDVPAGVPPADQPGGLEAVHARHHHVQQDDGVFPVQQLPQGVRPGGGRDHLAGGAAQHRLERQQILRVVVDHQDLDWLFSCCRGDGCAGHSVARPHRGLREQLAQHR